jgi:hypothetical protein
MNDQRLFTFKRMAIFAVGMLLALIYLGAVVNLSYGASTVTQEIQQYYEGQYIVTLHVQADRATGNVSSTQVDWPINGKLILVETSPRTATPWTAAYDVTLTDNWGIDVMQGELLNLDNASQEMAVPVVGTHYLEMPVAGGLTLNVSNNLATDAEVYIKLYFKR